MSDPCSPFFSKHPQTKALLDDHNALKEHWSAHFSSTLDLNHAASDHTYKHHIAQLMTIYTDTDQKLVDFNFKTKAMELPMTKLHGRRGVRSSGPEIEKIYKKREERWDNRMYLTENIRVKPKVRNQIVGVTAQQQESMDFLQSDSSILRVEPNRPQSQPTLRDRSSSPGDRQRHSQGGRSHSASRNWSTGDLGSRIDSAVGSGDKVVGGLAEDSAVLPHGSIVSEGAGIEDLLLQGLYRFDNDAEVEIYNKFVLMLTSFDSHDALLILQDAFKDAQVASMLDSYGGTGRPHGPSQRRPRSSRKSKGNKQGSARRGEGGKDSGRWSGLLSDEETGSRRGRSRGNSPSPGRPRSVGSPG